MQLRNLLGLAISGALSCSINPQSPIHFADVTMKAGLDYQYTFGDLKYSNILNYSNQLFTEGSKCRSTRRR